MPFDWFRLGGPVMYPLLACSVLAMTVVTERLLFIMGELKQRNPALVGRILSYTEKGEIDRAIAAGRGSDDFVVRTLVYGLLHRRRSFSSAACDSTLCATRLHAKPAPTRGTAKTFRTCWSSHAT